MPEKFKAPLRVIGNERWLSELTTLPISLWRRKEWLKKFNDAIECGSQPIDSSKHAELEEIMAARRLFLSMLGLARPRHSLHQPYLRLVAERSTLMHPRRAVEGLNAYSACRISASKLLRNTLLVAVRDPGEIDERMRYIQDQGGDPARVIEAAPSLMLRSPTVFRSKMPEAIRRTSGPTAQ